MFANSGAQRVIGSVRESRPSSISIRAATVVIGFVIEAMRNRVSRAIGAPVSRFRLPWQSSWTISPFRQIRVTAPARSPASITPDRTPRARARASISNAAEAVVAPSMMFAPLGFRAVLIRRFRRRRQGGLAFSPATGTGRSGSSAF
jgi:hypothetical protein